METVIPRWEWRTFGESFGESERRIRSSGEPTNRSRKETYILSFDSPNNTRILDGLMVIKRLIAVDANALERWNPVLKAQFPLGAADLARVFATWGVGAPASIRPSYALGEFLTDVVARHLRLKAVAVEKERHGYAVEGCIVEIADLKFDGLPIRTVAVEAEDPALVVDTVRRLGLGSFPNVNYIKALKRHAAIPEA